MTIFFSLFQKYISSKEVDDIVKFSKQGFSAVSWNVFFFFFLFVVCSAWYVIVDICVCVHAHVCSYAEWCRRDKQAHSQH